MRNKIIGFILCIIMLAGVIPAGLFTVHVSAESYEVPNFECYYNNWKNLIVKCGGISGAVTYQPTFYQYRTDRKEYMKMGYQVNKIVVKDGDYEGSTHSWEYDKRWFYESNNGTYAAIFAVELKVLNFYGDTVAYSFKQIVSPFDRYLDVPQNGYLSATGMFTFDRVDGAYRYEISLRPQNSSQTVKVNTQDNFADFSDTVRSGEKYYISVTAYPEIIYEDICSSHSLFEFTYSTSTRPGGRVIINDDRSITYTGYLDYLNTYSPEILTVRWLAYTSKWDFIDETEKVNYDPSFLAIMVSADGYYGTVMSADNTYTNKDHPYVAKTFAGLRSVIDTKRDPDKTVYIKLGADITYEANDIELRTNSADVEIDLAGYTLSCTDTVAYSDVKDRPRIFIAGTDGRFTISDSTRFDTATSSWVKGRIDYKYTGKTESGPNVYNRTSVLGGDVTVNAGIISNLTEKASNKVSYAYYGSGIRTYGGELIAERPAYIELGKEEFGFFGGTLRASGKEAIQIDSKYPDDGKVFPTLRNFRVYNESTSEKILVYYVSLPYDYISDHGEIASLNFFKEFFASSARPYSDGVERSSVTQGMTLSQNQMNCTLSGPYIKSRYELKTDVSSDSLNLTIIEPEVNALPDHTVIFDKTDLYDYELIWQYEDEPGHFSAMHPNRLFVSGVKYRAHITLYPKPGVIDKGLEKTKTLYINSVSASQSGNSFWTDFEINDKFYNVYIGHSKIGHRSRHDVLGDGGSVQYFKAGEYVAEDYKFDYGQDRPTLVFNDFNFTRNDYHNDGNNNAQICIEEDINIVLRGSSSLNKYAEADGIHIAAGHEVAFYGDGSLTVDVQYNKCFGLVSLSPVSIKDNADVTFKGLFGAVLLGSGLSRSALSLEDDADLFCRACSSGGAVDYPALTCGDLTIKDGAELVCEAESNAAAMDTYDVEFSSHSYDLMILKMNEHTAPYAPSVGVNVSGGVHESACRYIRIKPTLKVVTYGDVNSDGVVNLKDATLVRRYYVAGWGVTLDTIIADVNCDNAVNLKDATLIRRYYVGGWGVILGPQS
ncbi:MAG: dockerin type I repeat-containing protein [Clostridia bacterium]|nr:dockerin type I repeat-containing protein [Clostridia bacterium]